MPPRLDKCAVPPGLGGCDTGAVAARLWKMDRSPSERTTIARSSKKEKEIQTRLELRGESDKYNN